MSAATVDKPRGPEITYGYFGNIVKFEELDDGTLMVYGKAVGSELDSDKQICDPAWFKTATPDWFEWGNVREQHNSKIAAGVGKELVEAGDDDGGYYLKSHVVDPGTVLKVKTGVLKGYSVGISNGRVVRDKAAPGGRIVEGTIHEISLVDRPANAACSISIVKSVDGETFFPVESDDQTDDQSDVDAPDAQEPQAEDAATEPGDSAPADESVIEKSAAWYRDALRTVEDAYAGRWAPAAVINKDAGDAEHEADHADIAGASEAIDKILDLIVSEAQQAKGGRFKELRDIEVLLSAARSLLCFIGCEQAEDDGAGYDAETVGAYKAAGGGEPAGEVVTGDASPDTVDADSTDMITKAVESAQAEFRTAHEAEIATLRAELEKALAAPTTGGPVTFRVAQTSSAPAAALTADQPAYWRAMAEASNISPDVQRAYLAKAASLSKGAST